MPPRPQYLASETGSEPWGTTLRLVSILFGVVLLAAVAIPWSFSPLVFSFQALGSLPGAQKVWPIFWAAGGILLLVFGLGGGTKTRGLIATIIGAAGLVLPVLIGGFSAGGGGFGGGLPFGGGWVAYVLLAGFVLAPAGLLLRSAYGEASIGRLIATIGCAALIVPFVVPSGGTLPIIGLFKMLGGGIENILQVVVMLLLPIAAVLGLFTSWLPSSTSGGTGLWGRIIMWWSFLLVIMALAFHIGEIGGLLKQPVVLCVMLLVLGFPMLLGYGLASFFGKIIEENS